MDVHARDVVEKLKKEGVSSAEEFSWTSQMRCCADDVGLAPGGIVGQFCTGQFCTMLVPKCPYSYLGAKLSVCLLRAKLSGAKLSYQPWGGGL